jgi:hypothetical protein
MQIMSHLSDVAKNVSVQGSKPIHRNVAGAPFAIGQKVLVRRLIDQTGPRRFLKKEGTVEYLEYSCGCGQHYPNDPMIGVRFPGGELEEFWPEELKALAHFLNDRGCARDR